MNTILMVLHVLIAVIVVGPAMLVPWLGERALLARDGDAVHAAGRRTMAFNALTVLSAVFGTLAVATSDEYTFAAPWLIVSTTLYVLAVLNGAAVIPGVLARIGKELQDSDGVLDGEVLEQHRGRLLVLSGLGVVLYSAVIILMVWRP
ncbi:DUF2269 family protein [Glycomyces sp. L485]|uniref:DUF2269 family protein n=1 Tax=Glycomyces sp. L485 TaxID=2909235 RepID=UPI001F4B49AA|nr:DUF2269 family protein [Glycomyces sp. L485]MCH7232549.1 DUF2269 family protein [Glycomyces sp. L485]